MCYLILTESLWNWFGKYDFSLSHIEKLTSSYLYGVAEPHENSSLSLLNPAHQLWEILQTDCNNEKLKKLTFGKQYGNE